MDFSNAEIFLNIKISPYLYSALVGACKESIGQRRGKSNRMMDGGEARKLWRIEEFIAECFVPAVMGLIGSFVGMAIAHWLGLM